MVYYKLIIENQVLKFMSLILIVLSSYIWAWWSFMFSYPNLSKWLM